MGRRRPVPAPFVEPLDATDLPKLDEIPPLPLDDDEVDRLGLQRASYDAVERHPGVIAGRAAVALGLSRPTFTRARLLLWRRTEDAWRADHPQEDWWPRRGAARLPQTRRNPS